MLRYDCVFLDAQGTLLETLSPMPAIYADACLRVGKEITLREIGVVMQDLWREYRQSTRGQSRFDTSDELTRQWWNDYNARLFRKLGLSEGEDLFVEYLWDTFGRPDVWRTFPEVDAVLSELRGRNYRLGIVSNWDSRLLPICDSLGLTTTVDFIVVSALVGVEKPDPRIFETALAMAGAPADRVIHVGDDFEADVLGARGAGIEAVLLDRDERHPAERNAIRSLSELLRILP